MGLGNPSVKFPSVSFCLWVCLVLVSVLILFLLTHQCLILSVLFVFLIIRLFSMCLLKSPLQVMLLPAFRFLVFFCLLMTLVSRLPWFPKTPCLTRLLSQVPLTSRNAPVQLIAKRTFPRLHLIRHQLDHSSQAFEAYTALPAEIRFDLTQKMAAGLDSCLF